MGRRGFIGEWLYNWFGFSFTFSWRGAALASAVVAFPLMVRAIRLALEAVDQRMEQAARTLGASPLRVFFTITLPLSMPGIIAGIVLAPQSLSSPIFQGKPERSLWLCIR